MTGPAFSDGAVTAVEAPAGRDKPVCGALRRQADATCQRPAGWGTDHPGTGRCKLHGGSTGNHRKAARREQAVQTLKTLGIVEDPASLPTPVIAAELQLSAAKQLAGVRWLEQQVGELRPEQVELSPFVPLLRDARRDSDRLLVELARLGLDSQRVAIETRRVDVMVLVLQRVLADVSSRVTQRLGHDLPELSGELVGPLVHKAITDVGGEISG